MNEEHKNALQASLHDICQNLNAEGVLPYLRKKGIIQRGEAEVILAITPTETRNMRLIDYIIAAGPSAFQEFINALHICNKGFLIKEILKNLSSSSVQQLTLPEMNTQLPSTTSQTSAPSTSSSWYNWLDLKFNKIVPSRFSTIKSAQQSLKEKYLKRFKTVYPFSLPFTFDIENTWVSLALKDDFKRSQTTEDHAKLLERAFEKEKMLIIEGDPATGKTSLMRRLAYEWAQGKKEMRRYDLVIYAEFREVHEKIFENIEDLVLGCTEKYLEMEVNGTVALAIRNEYFCKERHVLILLDGYDESFLDKQCSELKTYLSGIPIRALLFNIVITTRKGYLSKLQGREGRFVFAEVLGFITDDQKTKYISNHFSSIEDSAANIDSVHHLLGKNKNLEKLAETPLFLTFICLVHEKIIDGTLLELYCNTIWWLIDRYQSKNPEDNVPAQFKFHNDSVNRFKIIQDYYLQFPQLHCLSKMALTRLNENVFAESDYNQFHLDFIIEQVGLLRKQERRNESHQLVTSFFFQHRTIQEFLAAFYCLCSDEQSDEWLNTNSKLDTDKMNEYERFLLRINLSEKMPWNEAKHKLYFERIQDIKLNLTFDSFKTKAQMNYELLNSFFSKCPNVQSICINGTLKKAELIHKLNFDIASINNKSLSTSGMAIKASFSLQNLENLYLLHFECCAFQANSHLSITNCPSVKNLKFYQCSIIGIILDISKSSVTGSLEFDQCTFEANSQLSFRNCQSLKILKFCECEMKSSTYLEMATLPAIETLEFVGCKTDLATWQSILYAIRNSSVESLKLSLYGDVKNEFVSYLKACNNVEAIMIEIWKNFISDNDCFSFSGSSNLHALKYEQCTLKAQSQLSFKNYPSLKKLHFHTCKIISSASLGFSQLPTNETLNFWKCTFEASSQLYIEHCPSLKNLNFDDCEMKSRTLEITISKTVDTLKSELSRFEANLEFSFKKCPSLKNIIFDKCDIKSTALGISLTSETENLKFNGCKFEGTTIGFATLSVMETFSFEKCTFEADSQLSFTNCPSPKNLQFSICNITGSTNLGIETLPAIDMLEFKGCKIDLATWELVIDQTQNSSIKFLKLSFEEDFNNKFLNPLQQCKNVGRMEITIRNHKICQNELLSFSDLMKLHSLIFVHCKFEANSQLSFTNCPSLKNLEFNKCEMKSTTNLGISTLLTIDTVKFYECTTDIATWQSITDEIRSSSIKYLKLSFGEGFNKKVLIGLKQCKNVQKMETAILNYKICNNDSLSFSDLRKLHLLKFTSCRFEADCQMSFTNCSSLKRLEFSECTIKSSITSSIAKLLAIETLIFDRCIFEANAQLPFTYCQSLTNLEFNDCEMKSGTNLGISTLPANGTVGFTGCAFEANVQLSFINCPSLKCLKYNECGMKSSTNLGITTLPANGSVGFSRCTNDLAAWQSITDQIRKGSTEYFKILYKEETNKNRYRLQNCIKIEIEIKTRNYRIHQNDIFSFQGLQFLKILTFSYCTLEAKSQLVLTNCPSLMYLKFIQCKISSSTIVGIATLPVIDTLTFLDCTFEENSRLSFTNCQSLKSIKFRKCGINSSARLGIATLPTIYFVEFYRCTIDLTTWQSIIDQIRTSSVRILRLSADYFMGKKNPLFLRHLQECQRIKEVFVEDYYYDQDDRRPINMHLSEPTNIMNRYEEEVTANLAHIALELSSLRSISIVLVHSRKSNERIKLKEENKKRIEKAGQERKFDFLVKYVEQSLSGAVGVKKANIG